ncbi:MAG: hypothetical protein BMS9Abin37_1499 [Acidobacteriota bacterium]|nr:MAG: hypothetical protein BMS9Abin37_1499 [Acidobacteriota bacterium]
MPRVKLVHWNKEEAEKRAKNLGDVAVEIVCDARSAGYLLRDLKRRPPAAVVVDLSRIPSQGRDLALALRESKATRSIPIVFVGGEREKVERIQKLLPDATYANWRGVRGALRRAISNPPTDPVVRNRMSSYAHKPPAQKLGIRPDSRVAMPGAPKDFAKALGVSGVRGRRDLTLWFVPSRAKLEKNIARMSRHVKNGALWILWPKKSDPAGRDLDPTVIRRAAEREGLVDFKIASINKTWSGLKFTRRKT